MPPHLLVQCASQTTFYGTYGTCLRWLGSDRDGPVPVSLLHNFIAGSFGGFAQSFPSSILELLKIRLQTTSERFITDNSNRLLLFSRQGQKQEANLYQVFRHLVKTEGVSGLTRGLHATIWRDTFTYGNEPRTRSMCEMNRLDSVVFTSYSCLWQLPR